MTNYGVYPPASGREVRAQLKVLIADITLTNPASFEMVPIPAGFEALELVTAVRSTAAAAIDVVLLTFNGDNTATNYSNQFIYGTGTSITTGRGDTAAIGLCPGGTSTAGDYSWGAISIQNHAAAVRRQAHAINASRQSATAHDALVRMLNWESTEPITSITLRTDNHPTDLFAAGSRVQVFGLGVFAVALAR